MSIHGTSQVVRAAVASKIYLQTDLCFKDENRYDYGETKKLTTITQNAIYTDLYNSIDGHTSCNIVSKLLFPLTFGSFQGVVKVVSRNSGSCNVLPMLTMLHSE